MFEISSKLKSAERLVGHGKISRREFMELAIAAGFTVATAEAMFVKAARAEPKRGGQLINTRWSPFGVQPTMA